MGQDDSCPICGKYWLHCGHLPKEHIKRPKVPISFCGRPSGTVVILDNEILREGSVDPEAICKHCLKVAYRNKADINENIINFYKEEKLI